MKSVTVMKCRVGEILAEDVHNEKGIMLVSKNTMINNYIQSKLKDHNISSIKIYESISSKKTNDTFDKHYKECILYMKELLRCVTLGEYHDLEMITFIMTEQIYNNAPDGDEIMQSLHSIKNSDEYTYTHSLNTAFYSLLMGRWINLPKEQICELITASLLHDIGKTRIPTDILNKNSKLSADEYEIIKMHPVLGHEIVDQFTKFSKNIKSAILFHHERMDGSGYPYGIRGKTISLYARIISIADVYDAMTQNRIYKKKVSPFDSFEMFLTEGLQLFDYSILQEFLKHMAPLYVGNQVQLTNGDIGEIVYIPPQDITSPILFINSEYMDLSKSMDVKVVQVV